MSLDISACRSHRPYSRREYMARFLWGMATPLFCFSPRPMFGWRRVLLRLFGAKVGKDAHVYPSARIYMPWNLTLGEQASIGEWALIYNLGPVSIGNRATVSHRAHLCAGTHDYENPTLPLLRPGIEVGDEAWVCTDAYVGPDRKVGEGAVVGAAAVVVKDVPPWKVVVGNPARVIKERVIRTDNPMGQPVADGD